MIYSFVNIPYGSLNASLTRDNDEISTLTTVRMTEANIGNLLVYTFLPLFVQMASPAKHLKDIGMFGIKLNLGNYASPHAAGAYFHVMSIYMLIGFILLLCTYFGVHERVDCRLKKKRLPLSFLTFGMSCAATSRCGY